MTKEKAMNWIELSATFDIISFMLSSVGYQSAHVNETWYFSRAGINKKSESEIGGSYFSFVYFIHFYIHLVTYGFKHSIDWVVEQITGRTSFCWFTWLIWAQRDERIVRRWTAHFVPMPSSARTVAAKNMEQRKLTATVCHQNGPKLEETESMRGRGREMGSNGKKNGRRTDKRSHQLWKLSHLECFTARASTHSHAREHNAYVLPDEKNDEMMYDASRK